MLKFVLFAFLTLSANLSHSAQPAAEPVDTTKQCVDECFAFYQTPGPELKRCIAECVKKSVAVCETYENDCDRGGDGPLF